MTKEIEKKQREIEMECVLVLHRKTNETVEEVEKITRKALGMPNGLEIAKKALEFLNYQYELRKQIQKEMEKYANEKLIEVKE